LATMGTMPRRPHVPAMIRFPPELHAQLAAVAERERRSLTAQVIHIVEQWLAERERERLEREGQGQPPLA
jgi:predicted HicB family RNase H-like nuclease